MSTSMIVLIALGVATALAVGVPQFRAQVAMVLRTLFRKGVDSSVTAVDKEVDAYNQAKKAFLEQQAAVQRVAGEALSQQRILDKKAQAVKDAEQKVTDAQNLKMDQAAVLKFAGQLAEAQTEYQNQVKNVQSAKTVADREVARLATTQKKLEGFSKQIAEDKNSSAITDAIKKSNEAQAQIKAVDDVLSKAGEAHDAIQRQRDQAEAAAQMNAPDADEAALETARNNAAAQAALDALNAKSKK